MADIILEPIPPSTQYEYGVASLPVAGTGLSDQLDRLQTSLADRYRIERELGRGGMPRVGLILQHRHFQIGATF